MMNSTINMSVKIKHRNIEKFIFIGKNTKKRDFL